jgi:hypothetical protein
LIGKTQTESALLNQQYPSESEWLESPAPNRSKSCDLHIHRL